MTKREREEWAEFTARLRECSPDTPEGELLELADELSRLAGVMKRPMPGDAVRFVESPATDGWWRAGWSKRGLGVIGGVVGEYREGQTITFGIMGGGAFRGGAVAGKLPEYVSASGGPGSICTRMANLRPTGETVELLFWRWKSLPCRDGGECYTLTVPLWEWDGRPDHWTDGELAGGGS